MKIIDQVELMMKHRGFTDRLYWLNFKMVWIFAWSCFALTAFSGERFLNITDLSIVSTGLPVAFGELGIHTGFIVWKAKVENCRKKKDYSRLRELEENEL